MLVTHRPAGVDDAAAVEAVAPSGALADVRRTSPWRRSGKCRVYVNAGGSGHGVLVAVARRIHSTTSGNNVPAVAPVAVAVLADDQRRHAGRVR